MINPYKEILFALAEANIDFIVGGGVACVLHGVERVTMDVDVAVHMTNENFSRFCREMTRLGLRPRVPVPPEVLLDPAVVKRLIEEKHALVFTFVDLDRPYRQVDVFLKPELTYEALAPASETVEIDGHVIRLIGRGQLLQIKRGIQPPRAKDQLDIEGLSRLLDE